MIKLIFSALLGYVCLTQIIVAEELPDEAQRELKELERKIEYAQRETEKKIVRKKRDAVKTLERVEKKIDNEFAKNLIKIQIVKYRAEIAESEGKLGDKNAENDNKAKPNGASGLQAQVRDAEKIIDFNQSYFYPHPLGKLNEIGEFKFYTSGKVNCYHREGNKVKMFKKWDWSIKDGKLVIAADQFHGPIFVSKKSPKEIYLDWKGMLNKKNVAKQK